LSFVYHGGTTITTTITIVQDSTLVNRSRLFKEFADSQQSAES
jgi:hypothetical protein